MSVRGGILFGALTLLFNPNPLPVPKAIFLYRSVGSILSKLRVNAPTLPMREITATVKLDAHKGFWSSVDHILRSLAIIALPLILAWMTWRMETQLRSVTTNQEYVKLAVSLLTQPVSNVDDPINALRSWAVELLQSNSPVKIPAETARQLAAGRIGFPVSEQQCFPPVAGFCIAEPSIVKVGQSVTFEAYGSGGSQLYVYSWNVDGKPFAQTRTCQATFDTPGPKTATVRITSNGQSIYKSVVVLVENGP